MCIRDSLSSFLEKTGFDPSGFCFKSSYQDLFREFSFLVVFDGLVLGRDPNKWYSRAGLFIIIFFAGNEGSLERDGLEGAVGANPKGVDWKGLAWKHPA